MQESRTAAIAATHPAEDGYKLTTGIGRTGVVLRADRDALPIQEDTGLEYASTASSTDPVGNAVPVAHACGDDMHVAWLMG